MPLRKRQDLESFSFGHIYYDQLQVDPDSGVACVKSVDQCVALPDKKNTNLGLLLKAGVPLEETRSKLIDPKGKIVFPAEENKGE